MRHASPVKVSKSVFKPKAFEYFRLDPADRIIIATAQSLGATLVTKDRRILSYPHVKTLRLALSEA